MSQFDKTTEKKGNGKFPCQSPCDSFGVCDNCLEKLLWQTGRNSIKASMIIMANTFLELRKEYDADIYICPIIDKAMAQVKANGDWPLEE